VYLDKSPRILLRLLNMF